MTLDISDKKLAAVGHELAVFEARVIVVTVLQVTVSFGSPKVFYFIFEKCNRLNKTVVS